MKKNYFVFKHKITEKWVKINPISFATNELILVPELKDASKYDDEFSIRFDIKNSFHEGDFLYKNNKICDFDLYKINLNYTINKNEN